MTINNDICYNKITEQLQQAGIENAVQEANWIVKYGGNNTDEIVQRRINREPLQYLLGEWEFYGYPFKVGKGVLIPRPETELLVDLAKQYCSRDSLVYDLCAGSGCAGISSALEIGCDVMAIEKSPQAIEYLKENIKLNKAENNVKIIHADILESFPELPGIDCILINPPYLSEKEMDALQKEVTHEPKIALYGGIDGLEFYREFFYVWSDELKEVSLLACEVGDSQAEKVCEMMENIGLSPKIKKDYNKINRVVYSIKE